MAREQIKLISWNVNGIRAALKKDFKSSFQKLDADIFAVQETKLQQDQLSDDISQMPGYRSYWSCATGKKGYSGVGVYARMEPRDVKVGLGQPAYDEEGRVIEMDFGEFTFFNVYFPNGQMGPERLRYKLDFYRDFFDYANSLRDRGKSLVVAGDYNTAHNEIDLKNPKANENISGFLRIERDWLDRIIRYGYVDTFRHFYPDTERYSWWTYRFKARDRNIGWRIDYFFVSQDLIDQGRVKEALIHNDIYGSDHCPIGLILER